ncbi:meprin A subunit alpha-like [Physella acuta]|uniref:meprin A subunit alpha-like n=1 Tax=Physella acuta TaxID=109671 RepID=UPI0027DB4268|nr:meprin A subunit alpha-like [Physella acuta]
MAAIQELERDINGPTECIKFIPRTSQATYIDINRGTGCHSAIGYNNNGRQSVSIGPGCEYKGIIMHELIHTIGFWHEHNRSDRDNYININMANVKTEYHHDFSIPTSSNNLHTAYDYGSIMHYGPYTFAIDRTHPVITPKPGHIVEERLGQRTSLSVTDVLKIQRLYGCREDTSHITTLAPRTFLSCHFVTNNCSVTIENTAVKWTVHNGSSPAGPGAGNSNGADPYMLARESPTHPGVARFHTPSYTHGDLCVDFYVYQKGPSSYLELLTTGPHIQSTVVKTFQHKGISFWSHTSTHVNIPAGTEYRLTFQAHLNQGDVAVDDIQIYSGNCV